ncbi:hypothetical protein NIE88_18815 [Sporolactobacillus shoreicorticis]|uniref:Uncharacterized protein n=1 Tax=Sporolactobacillus shoreicorticis TaxID=1923877 RepID=A0ABW5S5H1_9BACL|nr:hypothetical protein [Sporolactobacillus shoreicorticis]MCO7127802.1 hypothetical protein [Sporolactobacillus shoreicorticis]
MKAHEQLEKEMQTDEVKENFYLIAQMVKKYYDELIKQGFEPNQALYITGEFSNKMNGFR